MTERKLQRPKPPAILAFGFCEIALVLAFAFVFRGAGLLKRDGNGLTAAFELSSLAPWTAP